MENFVKNKNSGGKDSGEKIGKESVFNPQFLYSWSSLSSWKRFNPEMFPLLFFFFPISIFFSHLNFGSPQFMASPTNIFSPTIIFSPHLILFFSTWTFYFFLLVLFVFYAGFLPTVSYLYFYIDKGSDCLLYYLFHLSIPLTLLYYSQLHFVVNLWDTLSSWVLKGFKCKQTGNKSLKASCGLWPFLKTSTSWSRCCVGAEGFGGSRPDKPDLYWSSLRRNRRQTGRTKINLSSVCYRSLWLV